jgi:hypothetical protein
VINKLRKIYDYWKQEGIVTIELSSKEVTNVNVILPRRVNYDYLSDPKLLPLNSLIKMGISGVTMLEVLNSLQYNTSDIQFNKVFVEKRVSNETLKKLYRSIDTNKFKFIWRYIYNSKKLQQPNTYFESHYCNCHKNENSMIIC